MDNQTKKINDMRDFIVYLVQNQRPQLLQALQASGVSLNNPDNNELLTVIFTQISLNDAFKNNLKQLILQQVGGTSRAENVNDFFKVKNTEKKLFANFYDPDNDEDYQDDDEDQSEKTKAGQVISNVFSKENLNKYIDAGLAALKDSSTRKQVEQNIKIAELQLRQKALNSPGTPPAPVKKTNSWVLPVIIGVGVIGVIITVIVVVARKK